MSMTRNKIKTSKSKQGWSHGFLGFWSRGKAMARSSVPVEQWGQMSSTWDEVLKPEIPTWPWRAAGKENCCWLMCELTVFIKAERNSGEGGNRNTVLQAKSRASYPLDWWLDWKHPQYHPRAGTSIHVYIRSGSKLRYLGKGREN